MFYLSANEKKKADEIIDFIIRSLKGYKFNSSMFNRISENIVLQDISTNMIIQILNNNSIHYKAFTDNGLLVFNKNEVLIQMYTGNAKALQLKDINLDNKDSVFNLMLQYQEQDIFNIYIALEVNKKAQYQNMLSVQCNIIIEDIKESRKNE